MTKTPKNIIDEQVRMEKIRAPWKSLKELSIALSYPGRSDQYDYYCTFDDSKGKSNTKSRRVYDATARKGLDIWTKGIIGQYMPKDINWFAEQMADKDLRDSKIVIKWLQETDEHLRYVLNQSTYYEHKQVMIKDAAAIGDSYLYIDEDSDTGKLLCMAPHPREFWVSRDYWGRVVIIHHKVSKTVRDIEGEFGKQALSVDQRLKLDTSPDSPMTMIHGIYKNKDYDPFSSGVKNMPWQHYYVNVTTMADTPSGKMMRETGSITLNPIPWALNRSSHEAYGRGIVSEMLLEILTCNLIGKDMLVAGQVGARPPMAISSALKHKLDMGAGGVTFVGTREMQGLKMGDLIARLIDSSGYPFGIDNHQRWQDMVNERFGVPLFLAMNLDTVAKTLGEVRIRQAERATLMSPFLGTLGTVTDLELDRVFSIELQAGRAPEPPMEVMMADNGRIDIQYIGPLSQLLKQYYETSNLLTTIANIQAVLSVAPDSSVVIEGDELMRKILRSGNTPEDVILSQQDVTEIRAIAAQQQEMQMVAELAAQASRVIPNLSKKIEEDSVLSKLKVA